MENKPKTRLVKGSEEAKNHMANLRSKRGANKQTPVETTATPPPTPTQPIEIPPPTKARSKKINVDFP